MIGLLSPNSHSINNTGTFEKKRDEGIEFPNPIEKTNNGESAALEIGAYRSRKRT